jgi:hypothetical protein
MKLTDAILDLGKVVAFFPGLRKITGSINATLILCQALYWTPRTNNPDGWFYKTAEEWEKETALTYDEQFTARKHLKELELIEERNDRIDHKLWFRVNQTMLNARWEGQGGLAIESILPPKGLSAPERAIKKDLVDGITELMYSPGLKKATVKEGIESKLSVRLHINPSGKRWEDFIEYAYQRWITNKESIDTFIDWAVGEGFNPVYWSADKCKTVWPSAFSKTLDNNDGYVVESRPIEKEIDVAPMPKNIGRL